MFTGIVEEMGAVRAVTAGALAIDASLVLEGTKIGDSIAVNGVCLTVTTLSPKGFTADVMPETLRHSSLGALKAGDPVNLERAMPANGRFGGHIVTGHIDSLGHIRSMTRQGNAVWITIAAPAQTLGFIVPKGSIAIDGISLTVAETGGDAFSVSLIPHTGEQTSLLRKKTGDTVNLETDIIGKYVGKLLAPRQEEKAPGSGITLEKLQMLGF